MSDLESAFTDSWWHGGVSAPSYTRPPEYRGHVVPDILLSGHHANVAKWRAAEGERLTAEREAREREQAAREEAQRKALAPRFVEDPG
jgi:tRNA (guanine37-N1)-methyltransferase